MVITDNFDETSCTPQLRITIQPIIPSAQDPNKTGTNILPVKAADYALHLLYSLNKDSTEKLAQELVTFKQSCGNVTDGKPLGLHPCLDAEMSASPDDLKAHLRLADLLSRYASTLSAAAAMGTDLSQDPWVFYFGLVQKEKFIHQQNFNVATDPSSAGLDSKGKPKQSPFGNGMYEMATFVMGSTGALGWRASVSWKS